VSTPPWRRRDGGCTHDAPDSDSRLPRSAGVRGYAAGYSICVWPGHRRWPERSPPSWLLEGRGCSERWAPVTRVLPSRWPAAAYGAVSARRIADAGRAIWRCRRCLAEVLHLRRQGPSDVRHQDAYTLRRRTPQESRARRCTYEVFFSPCPTMSCLLPWAISRMCSRSCGSGSRKLRGLMQATCPFEEARSA